MLKNRRKTTKKRVWQTRKPRSVFENKNLYFFCFPSWKKTKRPEKWKTKNTSPRCFLYFDFVFHRIHQKNHFFLQKSRFKSSNFHSARFSFLTSFLRHQLLILLFPLYIHMTHDCPFTCCMSGGEWFVILNPIRVMFLTSDVIINFSPKEVAKHFYLAVTDKVRVQTTQ